MTKIAPRRDLQTAIRRVGQRPRFFTDIYAFLAARLAPTTT